MIMQYARLLEDIPAFGRGQAQRIDGGSGKHAKHEYGTPVTVHNECHELLEKGTVVEVHCSLWTQSHSIIGFPIQRLNTPSKGQ